MPSSNTSTRDEPFLDHQTNRESNHNAKKLSLIPLIFLIYFEVSGGPYGEELAVQSAGPFLAILGFLIFPFIWSIPEALITAELATAFPGNGGFVIWADQAFGPFWASQMGTWKFLCGVINLASFPVLCVDYLKLIIPILSSGFPRYVAIFATTLLLSFFNYTGLTIVGYTAVTLGVVSLAPFLVMSLIAIPRIDPARWVSWGEKGVKKDWTLFFNTLFWNLNFWDSVSTMAGEVENPQKIYPKALFAAVILACLSYLVPLLAATGAIELDQEQWQDGYLATIADIIAGKWLKIWVEIGAVLSVIGLFEAQLTSSAYQILGMSELGFLPRAFGARSARFNTPWVGIMISTVFPLAISYLDFADIISSANFLYSLGMLLEFASFLWLRKKLPQVKRPFSVPLGLPGLIVMCLIPSVFLVFVMTVATKIVLVISSSFIVFGIVWYFFINHSRSKKWFVFNKGQEHLDNGDVN